MSNRNWDADHAKNIEAFAKQIESLYKAAIRKITLLSKDLKYDSKKQFTFSDYPKLKAKADTIFTDLAESKIRVINDGIKNEWLLSSSKNDELVLRILPTSDLTKDQLSQFMNRNLDALNSFQARKIGGLDLSSRIWKQDEQFRQEIEMAIDTGLGEGKPAAELSRDIRSYLKEPDKLFRRVRNARGALVLSKNAKAYKPGTGVYRSSYKNAMRVARTEINAAYRAADHARWQQLPFVVGIQIKRSNRGITCDVCESLKGFYPKNFRFLGWHPQCMCFVVSVLATDEEIDKYLDALRNGEDISGINSENEITDVPFKYQSWVNDNNKRLLSAKTPPYWVYDNYVGGQFSKGLKPSITTGSTKVEGKPVSDSINLKQFFKGSTPTFNEIGSVIMEFAKKFPGNFRNGLGDVNFRNSKSYLMQHSMLYNPRSNDWIGKSSISISTKTSYNGFNPAEELRGAFAAMNKGIDMTFNQEYAVEALWHEILHAKTKSPPRKLSSFQTEKMETVNQFVARHTYPEFLEAFGVKAIHQSEILEKGFGYKSWVKNFRDELERLNIPETKAFKDLLPILMDDYTKIPGRLEKYLAVNTKK